MKRFDHFLARPIIQLVSEQQVVFSGSAPKEHFNLYCVLKLRKREMRFWFRLTDLLKRSRMRLLYTLDELQKCSERRNSSPGANEDDRDIYRFLKQPKLSGRTESHRKHQARLSIVPVSQLAHHLLLQFRAIFFWSFRRQRLLFDLSPHRSVGPSKRTHQAEQVAASKTCSIRRAPKSPFQTRKTQCRGACCRSDVRWPHCTSEVSSRAAKPGAWPAKVGTKERSAKVPPVLFARLERAIAKSPDKQTLA